MKSFREAYCKSIRKIGEKTGQLVGEKIYDKFSKKYILNIILDGCEVTVIEFFFFRFITDKYTANIYTKHRHAQCAYPGISGDHRTERSFKNVENAFIPVEFRFNVAVKIFLKFECAIN